MLENHANHRFAENDQADRRWHQQEQNYSQRQKEEALEGNLITPWITGRAGELNTVAVFVSVLFWGWMWSVWGLLLAVPIMVSIKAAADRIEPLQPLGELLGR